MTGLVNNSHKEVLLGSDMNGRWPFFFHLKQYDVYVVQIVAFIERIPEKE